MLKDHLHHVTSFKKISNTIQNKVLNCWSQVYRENILEGIKSSKYMAIQSVKKTHCSDEKNYPIGVNLSVCCRIVTAIPFYAQVPIIMFMELQMYWTVSNRGKFIEKIIKLSSKINVKFHKDELIT